MRKISKTLDIKIKRILTAIALVVLLFLAARYISAKPVLFLDIISSFIIIGIFYKFYNKLHQNCISYFFLIFTLILHDLSLYSTAPFGIKFEHYMHFIGGFTIAKITDRFFIEKLSKPKRFLVLIVFALGIGVIGEIIEWLGLKLFGAGEGFFQFGIGDEGGWDNSIIDLLFNSLGALAASAFAMFRKR